MLSAKIAMNMVAIDAYFIRARALFLSEYQA
jgi:hypothetical protein